jgi:predicted MFS family arabinose efflux permease
MLGFFFPTGMRFLTARDDGSVPLAYAFNGAASVIAAPLASVMAVAWGLRMLLLISAILYCIALFIMRGRLPGRP